VTGATIDHMISVTILIAALLVAMMTFNGLFSSAVDYDRNRQVANKAIDIMNTICLSPGSPTDWGETNKTLLGFGLQDPRVGGYALSPYSIMRLNTASDINPLVLYNGTYYNNISTSFGHAVLTPIGDCVNYTTAAELLGINGTYGFSVDITPTLNVIVNETGTNPWLTLNVKVHGSGLPLSGATLNSYLFYVNKTGDIEDNPIPFISLYPNVTHTDSSGSVDIEFPQVTGDAPVYSFVVYVSLGGLNGVGSYSPHDTLADNVYIVPLIEEFDNDNDGNITLTLVHSWDTIMDHPSGHAEVKFNSTFYVLTSDFRLQEFDLNCSGNLNYGSQDYATTEIPSSEVGLLVISYRKSATEMGSLIVPWGVGALGVPASFAAGISSSSGYDFVATELRQVTIDGISYQVKVSTWSLSG
jgi:hypothetical protein